MFRKHVRKELSAYCNGELDADQSRRVADHLQECRDCQTEYEEIRLGVSLAESLPLVEAPSELWNEIEAALNRGSASPAKSGRMVSLFGPWRAGYAFAALGLLVLIAGVVWYLKPERAPEEIVKGITGMPPEIKTLKLTEGETFETDKSTRAKIEIGTIGHVDIEPNSRGRMISARANEHRLALDRGKLQAQINAPPRLFFVDTPAAEAVDLGCAYTLEVDDAGKSFLHVTYGSVALVRNAREVWVPIGAMCQGRPGIGPGTPYFENASENLIRALERFDFDNGGVDALDIVLAESRDKDTYTLWHLLSSVNVEQRERVLDRMIELVGLPPSLTRQGVMKLNQKMLDRWKDDLDPIWFQ